MNARRMTMQAIGAAALLWTAVPGFADTVTLADLRTAANFAVLGGSTVTNTGSTTLTGSQSAYANLGCSPGTSITGLEQVTFTGGYGQVYSSLSASPVVAYQAQVDARLAYNTLSTFVPVTANLTATDLGSLGQALAPGVYYNTISVLPVPEPSSFGALALGLMTLCACRRRRQPAAG